MEGRELSRQQRNELRRMIACEACRRHFQRHSVNFEQACEFWGFDSLEDVATLDERIEETTELLARALAIFARDTSSHGIFNLGGCGELSLLHEILQNQFTREIAQHRGRSS